MFGSEIDWRLQRNILFLHDYLNVDQETIPGPTRERILACARIAPVIPLADLIQQTAEFATPDDIYLMIAGGRLYVDLYAEPLVEPVKVRVFQDRDSAIRHEGGKLQVVAESLVREGRLVPAGRRSRGKTEAVRPTASCE